MSFPEDILSFIASHLPGSDAPITQDISEDQGRSYTIDELARTAETTVRNIRAYQDKGLLPPPELRGRKGFYSSKHLARLRVISGLLDRGFTLASIGELLSALEQGIDLRNLLGLETAITSPWTDEEPQLVTAAEIQRMFGDKLTPEAIARAVALDLVRPEGDRLKVRSMRTLRAGAELVQTGIPFEELLEIMRMLRGNVERVANELVKLVGNYVLAPFTEGTIPPKEEFPQIAELIWRLRPLAEMAVHAEVARAMEKAATRILSDKLQDILEHMEQEKAKDRNR
ncbi:MAG: MerR family transcriptional regulator [Hahellaceae bacterium]|nr:MerR family transcriptional regulator [Hahellaceae bacterium]MCP5169201.1 MerR family transcriptional regulator [Hahellaceae bacterium]